MAWKRHWGTSSGQISVDTHMVVQCKGMIDSSWIFYKEIDIHRNTCLKGEDESVVDFSYGMGVSEFTMEIFGAWIEGSIARV